MTTDRPPIQLIANLVVEGEAGTVLLARYDPAREADESEATTRWWLPAHELARIQSFRGRRGWHISFDFHIQASGEPASSPVPAAWHRIDDLPATMHGNWERETILSVRAEA